MENSRKLQRIWEKFYKFESSSTEIREKIEDYLREIYGKFPRKVEKILQILEFEENFLNKIVKKLQNWMQTLRKVWRKW